MILLGFIIGVAASWAVQALVVIIVMKLASWIAKKRKASKEVSSDESRLADVKAVAEYLGRSTVHVYGMIKKGVLHVAGKKGRNILIDLDELNRVEKTAGSAKLLGHVPSITQKF